MVVPIFTVSVRLEIKSLDSMTLEKYRHCHGISDL